MKIAIILDDSKQRNNNEITLAFWIQQKKWNFFVFKRRKENDFNRISAQSYLELKQLVFLCIYFFQKILKYLD
jgi:hypothetical protein